ncbi:MAG: ABC transporter permease [Ilumatobacter sp.]|nr:MAG: ABC transporter permease [Ilumatobacter sp.]
MSVIAPVVAGTERRQSFVAQTSAMSQRAVLALWRQPAIVVPSLIFPLFFAALGASSFSRAIGLPGFPPVRSFLDFALAGTIVQGILFGSITGATALATDIENGFFDRLMASPTSRTSILLGRLAGGMVYGAFQTVFFVAVLIPFGLTIASGVPGIAVMVLGGVLTALAVGALMSAMAIRTGSSEAVQGSFPLLFIMLFFSSAFFPRETMSGVYARMADLNPVSHLIEGFRDLTIDGFTASAVARTLLISGGLAVLTMAIALRSLRKRVAAR